MAYAVTKAAQVQLIKCMATTQGPKIRINTVLPGLLLTEWVSFYKSFAHVYFPALFLLVFFTKRYSPLTIESRASGTLRR